MLKKLDSIIFFIATRIPLPKFLQHRIQRYAANRVQDLQQELIRQNWQKVKLEKELQQIKEAQQQD